MEHVVPHRWAGVDLGKGRHSVCLIELADQPDASRQQITHVTTHVLASYAKAVRAGLPNAVAPRAIGVTTPSVAVARDGSFQKLPDEPTAHLGIERRPKGERTEHPRTAPGGARDQEPHGRRPRPGTRLFVAVGVSDDLQDVGQVVGVDWSAMPDGYTREQYEEFWAAGYTGEDVDALAALPSDSGGSAAPVRARHPAGRSGHRPLGATNPDRPLPRKATQR